MICFPNAKINLGLHVLDRRPDGYHNLETLFLPINLSDVLEVTPAPNQEDLWDIDSPTDLGTVEQNIIFKALQRLRQATHVPPLQVSLIKNIPTQAGLGGGSADAALMLYAANQYASPTLSMEELAQIAAHVGADCPFFLLNKPALAQGIGDRLHPIEAPEYLSQLFVVIVKPSIGVSTAHAYRQLHLTPRAPHTRALSSISLHNTTPEQWKDLFHNDFQPVIFAQHPQLNQIIKMLYEAGASYAAMSGSGTALYGIFTTPPPRTLSQSVPQDCFVWEGHFL